jgi:MFS family permease
VSVALPSIQRDLGGGLAGQQWVSNAYLLTLGSLILLGGSLGDIFGERRVFALGVAGFGVASLACALAPSIGFLIAFRALQGIAGALLTPSSSCAAASNRRRLGPRSGLSVTARTDDRMAHNSKPGVFSGAPCLRAPRVPPGRKPLGLST